MTGCCCVTKPVTVCCCYKANDWLLLCCRANGDMKHDASDDESEEENPEGDYTVYECPGLAPVSSLQCIENGVGV